MESVDRPPTPGLAAPHNQRVVHSAPVRINAVQRSDQQSSERMSVFKQSRKMRPSLLLNEITEGGGFFLSDAVWQLQMTEEFMLSQSMCSSVTYHHASVTDVMHQDASANGDEPRHSTYNPGNKLLWGFSGLYAFFFFRKIYYEQSFRSDAPCQSFLQAFIFVLRFMGKMLSGPHGVFGCRTSNGHWKNSPHCHIASLVSSSRNTFLGSASCWTTGGLARKLMPF